MINLLQAIEELTSKGYEVKFIKGFNAETMVNVRYIDHDKGKKFGFDFAVNKYEANEEIIYYLQKAKIEMDREMVKI